MAPVGAGLARDGNTSVSQTEVLPPIRVVFTGCQVARKRSRNRHDQATDVHHQP